MSFIAVTELLGNINSRKADHMIPILDDIARSKKIAGLLLKINSPGGDATASEILYRKLVKVRENKPVFISIASMCASGAYWVASGSTRIFAMETSLVGSIGVIGIYPNFKKFLDRVGIDVNISKVGKYKDLNNPFVEPSEEGKEKMEKIMNSVFMSFRNTVSKERNFDEPKADKLATGEIFSSSEALSSGLIDEIGTYDDALEKLREKTGVKKVKEVMPRRPFVSRFVGTVVRDSLSELTDSGRF